MGGAAWSTNATDAAPTNHTVARRLFLSEKTVRNHVSACLHKLQVAGL